MTTGKQDIRGVYESCIGVPDLEYAIKFWQQLDTMSLKRVRYMMTGRKKCTMSILT